MALKTRKPTGQGLWPKILLEGEEKSGKSMKAALLSASAKVGRTVVLVLGEDVTKWDDFGKIDGARFEIIEHAGSWPEIMGAAEDARDEAAKALANGEPPFVFVFDTISAEWEGLKDWASWRARNTQKARERLARDPNAEIETASNFWNDARARHRQLMGKLLTLPGIVVLIARGEEVALFRDNKPVANQTSWSVDSEKRLVFDVTAHVRMYRKGSAELITAAGVNSPFEPGDDQPAQRLPKGWKLETLIFDTLGLDASKAGIGGVIEMQTDQSTPEQILDEARNPETTFAGVRELHALALQLRYDRVNLPNERGQDEPLPAQLIRIGKAKQQAEQRAAAERAVRARDEALKVLDPDDSWLMPVSGLTTLADEETLRAEFVQAFADKPDDEPRKKALTVLLDLKRAELRGPAGRQAPAASAAPAAVASAPAPAAETATAAGTAPEDDTEWIVDFEARLADTKDQHGIDARKLEVNKALAEKKILPRMASDLHKGIAAKGREIRSAA